MILRAMGSCPLWHWRGRGRGKAGKNGAWQTNQDGWGCAGWGDIREGRHREFHDPGVGVLGKGRIWGHTCSRPGKRVATAAQRRGLRAEQRTLEEGIGLPGVAAFEATRVPYVGRGLLLAARLIREGT